MALTSCPECSGKVSNKALMCPHCGFPLQQGAIPARKPKRGRKRRPNGSGTIVPLTSNQTNPFQVRVNTRIDDRGYPKFDILGNFPDRVTAEIALSDYNKDPYDVNNRKKLFKETFESWYEWKYKEKYTAQKRRTNSQYCMIAAFKQCSSIHDRPMNTIRSTDLQEILDRNDLSHSMLEHIKNLLNQLYKYALEFGMAQKNIAEFTKINKEDDTEGGVPFTKSELELLWKNKDKPYVDTILIYCYSGWRINELARMDFKNIDLQAGTFTGGLKTRYSRNRTVPIHSGIFDMVAARYNTRFKSLIYHDGAQDISEGKYREYFNGALLACGIKTEHTPHDCRHTFNQLLDEAGVDRTTRYKLMGHTGKDINENVYTHKTVEQLREAVEKIKI